MCIQEKLIDWAKETVKVYYKQSTDLGFYTQTPLCNITHTPDLLILGINPGYGGGKENMSGEDLLKGNPCFDGKDVIKVMSEERDQNKNIKGWALWHKIHKMLGLAGKGELLETLDKFTLSNMVFFGTEHQGDIPKNIDQDICAQKTLELIDILRPKVVLLLGDQTKDLFMKSSKISHIEELIPNYHVFYCYYNNRHVISIYHTAYYSYYNFDNMAIVGNIIGYALDNSKDIIDKIKLEKDIYERPLIRAINIKNLLNRTDAIPLIDKDKALSYDFWKTIKNANYVKSKDNIVIALTPEEGKKRYVVLIFTRQKKEEKTKELINGIWPNKEFNPWECDKSRHVHEVISFEECNEVIKNKLEKVLQEVKAYRDKKYPLNK